MAQSKWKTAAPADSTGQFPAYRIQWLSKLMYGDRFEFFILSVILVNGAVLAVLTLDGLSPELETNLLLIDRIALWVYIIELGARLLSYGTKPWMFFKSPWNVFDFLIIGATPFFQGQTIILRLLRLFRIIRIFRFLPEVRILTASVIKSVPPLASLSVLISFLLFLYAMSGHYMFGAAAPENWGDVGAAMKSLFILLTLENFPNYFEEGMAITPMALVYFVSYIFIIVFTVLNILIGIVLNAMDQAREEYNTNTREIKIINDVDSELFSLASADPYVARRIEKIRNELAEIKDEVNKRR